MCGCTAGVLSSGHTGPFLGTELLIQASLCHLMYVRQSRAELALP